MVSTKFKRSQLRRIWRQVPTTHATLLDALNAANDTASLSASTGSGSIVETSGNGHSTKYADPNAASSLVAPADIAEMASDFLDLYDSAQAALIAAGTPAPTDEQTFEQMLAELQPAYHATVDYSNLQYARG